ncbi:unnamed protein product [Brassica oleracea]
MYARKQQVVVDIPTIPTATSHSEPPDLQRPPVNPHPSTVSLLSTALPLPSTNSSFLTSAHKTSSSSPPKIPRPSLKRSRSSPTFSPTTSANPNPFTPQPSDPIKNLTFAPLPTETHPPPLTASRSSFCFNKFLALDPCSSESHVKELSLLPLMSKLCPSWHFASNHQSDEDGRIILIWKDPIKLAVIHQSSQSITCLLTIPNKEPFYYTAIYAENLAADRADLWADLIYIHSTYDLENNIWFVGGDFNQILHHAEHSSPNVVSNDYQMYLLQDCFLQLGIFDLRFNGPTHTWKNNHPEGPIAKKLDRLLVNRAMPSPPTPTP